jgi:hypothetical protein
MGRGFKGPTLKTHCTRCPTPLNAETRARPERALCHTCWSIEVKERKVKQNSKPKENKLEKYAPYSPKKRAKLWQEINWEYKACNTREERGEFLGKRLEEISKDKVLMEYIFRQTAYMKTTNTLRKKKTKI